MQQHQNAATAAFALRLTMVNARIAIGT